MDFKELLKDKPDVLEQVNNAINEYNSSQTDKAKQVRFVDLSEGGYVDKNKYSTLQEKYNKDVGAASQKAKDKYIDMAINSIISGFGIEDKIVRDGIKGNIDRTKINIDDDFVISGLDEQINEIKSSHPNLFTGNVRVNTRTSETYNNNKRVYGSLDEISKLSVAEFNGDRDNIMSQIAKLSKK